MKVATTTISLIFGLCCMTAQAVLPSSITIINQTKQPTITAYAALNCATPTPETIDQNQGGTLNVNRACQIAINNSKQWSSDCLIVITSDRTKINDIPSCKFNYKIAGNNQVTFTSKN